MRGRDGHVDSPGLVEQPFVAGIVDAGDDTRRGELGLGQQRQHDVGLVVAGRGDHHVELLEMHLLEQAQLARVAEPPIGGRYRIDVEVPGLRSMSSTSC